MSKEREDETEELEQTEPNLEDSQGDDQPEISVKESGNGEHTVEVARETRKERREREAAERTRKLIEEAQKPLRDQLALMAQQRQQPVQFVPQQQEQPQERKQGADPEWRRLAGEQARIVALVRASQDPEEIKRLEDEWHDVEYKKQQLVASSATRQAREQFERDHPPAENPVHRMARTEFADVLNYGPDATALASAYFTQEKVRAYRAKTPFDELAAHRKALQQAAEELGIRQKPLPARNPAQQGRFSSLSTSSTGNASSGGPGRPLRKDEKAMAIAYAGPGVAPEKAYAMWSKMMGPDYFREA